MAGDFNPIPFPRGTPRQHRPRRPAVTRRRSPFGRGSWQNLLFRIAWLVAGWIASRFRARARSADYSRIDHPAQTMNRGFRWTEAMRDVFRGRWLRVRK